MIIMKYVRLKMERNNGVIKKNIIQTIKDKEMTRKDFLKYSGVILVGIVGLKGIMSLLTSADEKLTNNQANNTGSGFGNGRYGM